MNKEAEPQTSPPPSPAPSTGSFFDSLGEHTSPEFMDFFRKNGLPILIGVAIAVIGYVGISIYRNVNLAKEQEAMSLLMAPTTGPEQFQRIVDGFPGTTAAPLARLALGAAYFDQGRYDLARAHFSDFLTSHPRHDFAPNAELALAQTDEATLNLNDALARYDRFITERPGHFLHTAALFGKGRVLEQLKRFDEAVATYQTLLDADPDSEWAARAESNIQFAEKARRADARGDTLPPLTRFPVLLPENDDER
ncbi:MAG TPA: tetratricopeptide repeat protein [Kiritimatiellia bacterium]|nr:tetratricopeptide repeat protein [Kiritimatiellia bacterium]